MTSTNTTLCGSPQLQENWADMEAARKLAEQAIWDAAQTKDNPADLINIALEELVRARLELPAYSLSGAGARLPDFA